MTEVEVDNPDRYYLGDTEVPLNTEEARNGLVRRLRQYLELRNVSFLLGNGCSLPAGAPTIGNVRTIRDELDAEPYRLQDRRRHTSALGLLDHLLSDNLAIGVEPLLALLAGLRASLRVVNRPQTLDRRQPPRGDRRLERGRRWLQVWCRDVAGLQHDTHAGHPGTRR